ncbi:hypothetical protein C8F01DRAFT_1166967 [Mycena amicta]|nr:hypothetical protein C8F01DRAFT_1166967 [Mycena amicta]
MTTFQRVADEQLQEEHVRLWRIEKGPDVKKDYDDMKRDQNARLGQAVRTIMLRQHPPQVTHDHRREFRGQQLHDIRKLCEAAEREEQNLGDILHEGVEAQAANVKSVYVSAGLEHPGELDPTAHVREQLAKPVGQQAYCSPVLHKALFWENIDKLPERPEMCARLEVDFTARVDALLEFHHIAFNADVAVMTQLYDDALAGDRAKRRELLRLHQEKMETLAVEFSDQMTANIAQDREYRLAEQNDAAIADAAADDWVPPNMPMASSAKGQSELHGPSRKRPRAETSTNGFAPQATNVPRGIANTDINAAFAQGRPVKRATGNTTWDPAEVVNSNRVRFAAPKSDLPPPSSFFQEHYIAPEELPAKLQAAYDEEADRNPMAGIHVYESTPAEELADKGIRVSASSLSSSAEYGARPASRYEIWTPGSQDQHHPRASAIPRSFVSASDARAAQLDDLVDSRNGSAKSKGKGTMKV